MIRRIFGYTFDIRVKVENTSMMKAHHVYIGYRCGYLAATLCLTSEFLRDGYKKVYCGVNINARKNIKKATRLLNREIKAASVAYKVSVDQVREAIEDEDRCLQKSRDRQKLNELKKAKEAMENVLPMTPQTGE